MNVKKYLDYVKFLKKKHNLSDEETLPDDQINKDTRSYLKAKK